MSEFSVRSSRGTYSVRVGLGSSAGMDAAPVALVDPVVLPALPRFEGAVIELVGSEEEKTLVSCERVLIAMNRSGLRRGQEVVACGGGVIQDVATLVSSLYMRGVDWRYVPTTLMAMADSCIGGKSSINAGGIKNLVGNFHPPTQVLVDPVFITTLPTPARVAGLAEAVKICFARGSDALGAFLQSPAALRPGADDETAHLIEHVLRSKKWFVEIDEFDRAERRLLNFGHSFGHAWESACGFAVQHGEAVAVGMLAALRHPASVASGSTSALSEYTRLLLAPVRDRIAGAARATDWARFRSALGSDKKNSATELRLVLPAASAPLELVALPLHDSQLDIAADALRAALEEITA